MNERLPGLDALRGIAAITVVAFHLGLPIEGAHLAVDFFFMLSGYVMARTYENRLRDGSLKGWRFLWARYRRLWGWMALGTTIGLLALLGRFGWSSEVGLAYLLMLAMLPAFNLASAPYLLNLPLWSIVYELVANALHGLFLARRSRFWLVALALGCALGLGWTIQYAGFPRGGFVDYHWLVLLRVGLAYALGVLIHRLWVDRPPIPVPFALAAIMLPVYCLLVWLWPWQWAPLVFVLVLAPLMLFAGMATRFSSNQGQRLATLLGALSFPLYALHFPAIQLLQLWWGPFVLALMGAAILRRYGHPWGQDPINRTFRSTTSSAKAVNRPDPAEKQMDRCN